MHARGRTLIGLMLGVLACDHTGPATPAESTRALAPAPAWRPGPFIAGQVYVGRSAYIEYRAGDLPVILSAPHGGMLAPAGMPDRTAGTTATDSGTIDLVIDVARALSRTSAGTPHIVICHLRRRKVDVNRDVGEAARGNAEAGQAWAEYHGFLEAAVQAVAARSGRGLYIDIHGHSHPLARVELGYLLSAADLAQSDDDLNSAPFLTRSSLRTWVPDAPATLAGVLRGPDSLGALLAKRGYPAVPSPAVPSPGDTLYFSGGYSTARHGSSIGGPVGGVQVEAPYAGVRDTAVNRRAFAHALADSIQTFVAAHAAARR